MLLAYAAAVVAAQFTSHLGKPKPPWRSFLLKGLHSARWRYILEWHMYLPFASRSDRNGREVFVLMATSGRRRTRLRHAGWRVFQEGLLNWETVVLTTPISCLLSKARKELVLSENVLKRQKARTPSKLMTRVRRPPQSLGFSL